MQNVPATATPCKPVPAPSPAQSYALSDLVGRIANTLEGDGSWIADGTLDSQGMTIVAGSQLYRVEVSYEGPADANAIRERMDWESTREADRDQARLDRRLADLDTDWMADTGDDIAF